MMFAETKSGVCELSGIMNTVLEVQNYVAKSIEPILNSSMSNEDAYKLLKGNLFEVLISSLDLMGRIEEYFVRNKAGRARTSTA